MIKFKHNSFVVLRQGWPPFLLERAVYFF